MRSVGRCSTTSIVCWDQQACANSAKACTADPSRTVCPRCRDAASPDGRWTIVPHESISRYLIEYLRKFPATRETVDEVKLPSLSVPPFR